MSQKASLNKLKGLTRKLKKPVIAITPTNIIWLSPYNKRAVSMIKEIHPSQRNWNPQKKLWTTEKTVENLEHLKKIGQEIWGDNVVIGDEDSIQESRDPSQRVTYYTLLDVKRDASQREIKKAYRKKAIQFHPDKNQDKPKSFRNKFIEIKEAYQVLSNPEKRRKYDAALGMLEKGDQVDKERKAQQSSSPFTRPIRRSGMRKGKRKQTKPDDDFLDYFGFGKRRAKTKPNRPDPNIHVMVPGFRTMQDILKMDTDDDS